MVGKRIGYIRVSTTDQNPDRQLEGIQLDKKFIDYSSGRSTDRPELKLLMEYCREDDTVFIHSMDRLARNLKDLKNLVDFFISKNVSVSFSKENLTFSKENSATSNLMLHLMGAFAEFEHAFILERQREGIEIAKKRGVYKGKPTMLNKEMEERIKQELLTRKTKSQIAKDLGICRLTLYRYLKDLNLDG